MTWLLGPLLAVTIFLPTLLVGSGPVALDEPLKTVSYYPRDYSRERMWLRWPEARQQMMLDLPRIRDLGANTVRIFLQPSTFGYPRPTAEAMARLEDALSLIDAHGLRAHVNLFSCWGAWEDLDGSRAWTEAIVGAHRGDRRIALWELRNEAQLDRAPVRQWVAAVFPVLKRALGGSAPATVSVNRVEWLSDLRALTASHPPDLYILHWYPTSPTWTTTVGADLDRARQLVGGAPLGLGEFGYATYRSSEIDQRDLYRDVLYHASRRDFTSLGAWTLNDFPADAGGCNGITLPPAAQFYGLYRLDGAEKPAAEILRQAFQGRPPAAPSPARIVNPSFEVLHPYSGLLDGWLSWDAAGTGQPRIARDCRLARAGSCAARITGPGGMVVGAYSGRMQPVEPGRTYSLRGYARTSELDGWAQLVLAWYDADGRWLAADARSPTVTTRSSSSWTGLAIAGAAPPARASYFQAYVQMYSRGAATSVWFDDVELTLDGAAPAPRAAAPRTAHHLTRGADADEPSRRPSDPGRRATAPPARILPRRRRHRGRPVRLRRRRAGADR